MALTLFMLCLVVATSAALPHGDRKLKDAAISILVRTEIKAAEIINKVLIERSAKPGKTAYGVGTLTEVRDFLKGVLSDVSTFEVHVMAAKQGKSAEARASHRPSFPDAALTLPPWLTPEDLEGLDYDEILDLIGDYTKGFMDTLLPAQPIFLDREAVLAELEALVDRVLDKIRSIPKP